MRERMARNIAELLNRRNHLPNPVNPYHISDSNYFYIAINEGKSNEEVLACAKLKKTTFYSYEARHIAVNERYEKQGLGGLLLKVLEDYIVTKKVPMITATTTCGNDPMIHIFRKFGYNHTKKFINSNTEHELILWTKFINV